MIGLARRGRTRGCPKASRAGSGLGGLALAILILGGSGAASALEVTLYSEFRRIGPKGEIAAQDRGTRNREILSPAVVRNGFTSFFLVIRTPPGQPFQLYLAQNPDGVVQPTLYQPVYGPGSARGVPDRLEKILSPVKGTLASGIGVYWLDLWVPADAVVRRIRLEVQLNVGEEWLIYPMELRAQSATIPDLRPGTGALAGPERPSALTAFNVVRALVCGASERFTSATPSVRSFLRRNAIQDLALARRLERTGSAETIRVGIRKALEISDSNSWCEAPAASDPEIYLRVRDFLYSVAVD